MTTLQNRTTIDVLAHCDRQFPTPHPDFHDPAAKRALLNLMEVGAIISREDIGLDCYKTTELGTAWMKALQRVPIPKLVYVDANGDILD